MDSMVKQIHTFRILTLIPSQGAYFVDHESERLTPPCPICGGRYIEPLFPGKIEFCGLEVCDFHMAGRMLIARRTVAEELSSRFSGIEVKEVEVYRGVSLWSNSTKRPLMAKDYKGPEMAELWFPLDIAPDPGLSTLHERERCDECGIVLYDVKGVERISKDEPSEIYHQSLNHFRDPDMGLRVRKADLHGAMAYRYGGGRAQVLQPVKDFILERGWLNVEFVDYGLVV
jgi:hypothetical protein